MSPAPVRLDPNVVARAAAGKIRPEQRRDGGFKLIYRLAGVEGSVTEHYDSGLDVRTRFHALCRRHGHHLVACRIEELALDKKSGRWAWEVRTTRTVSMATRQADLAGRRGRR